MRSIVWNPGRKSSVPLRFTQDDTAVAAQKLLHAPHKKRKHFVCASFLIMIFYCNSKHHTTPSGYEASNHRGTKSDYWPRALPAGKQLLVSVLGGGTKTLSGAGKELSTQMTGTADHHRITVDEKTFTRTARKKEEPCMFFLMRVSITQAVKVFEGGVGENFFQKVSPTNPASFFQKVPPKKTTS